MNHLKFKKNERIIFFIVIFTIFIDQLSKYIVSVEKLSLFSEIKIFSWLNLVYVENKGISFGMLSQFNISFFLGILSFLISFYIIYLLKCSFSIKEKISLSLILGGAIGNGIDRVKNSYVIDFIDISIKGYHWPAFNFADSFITVGGVWYFWIIFFKKNKEN